MNKGNDICNKYYKTDGCINNISNCLCRTCLRRINSEPATKIDSVRTRLGLGYCGIWSCDPKKGACLAYTALKCSKYIDWIKLCKEEGHSTSKYIKEMELIRKR